MKHWIAAIGWMLPAVLFGQVQWDTIILFQTYEQAPFRALAIQEDDYISYTETVDGYTIVLNEAGEWCYAVRKGDDLVPSRVKVHDPIYREEAEKRFLEKLPKHLRYGPDRINELKLEKLKLYDYEQYLRFRDALERMRKQRNKSKK